MKNENEKTTLNRTCS